MSVEGFDFRMNYSLLEEAHEYEINLAQPCEEFLKKCVINQVDVNCSEIFFHFATDMGQCCVFNILPAVRLWDKDNIDHEGTFKLNYMKFFDLSLCPLYRILLV